MKVGGQMLDQVKPIYDIIKTETQIENIINTMSKTRLALSMLCRKHLDVRVIPDLQPKLAIPWHFRSSNQFHFQALKATSFKEGLLQFLD